MRNEFNFGEIFFTYLHFLLYVFINVIKFMQFMLFYVIYFFM